MTSRCISWARRHGAQCAITGRHFVARIAQHLVERLVEQPEGSSSDFTGAFNRGHTLQRASPIPHVSNNTSEASGRKRARRVQRPDCHDRCQLSRTFAKRLPMFADPTPCAVLAWQAIAILGQLGQMCLRRVMPGPNGGPLTSFGAEVTSDAGQASGSTDLPSGRSPIAGDPSKQWRADPGPFVGRRPELALLDEALVRARGGSPQIVAVEGIAGIGKTTLVRHFAGQSDPSRVFWCSADQDEMDLPWGLLGQLADAARAKGLDEIRRPVGWARPDD